MPRFSRRDFIRAAAALPGAVALSKLAPGILRGAQAAGTAPSILILVFDAMSASNLSLYGYHRQTTPNFERFAQRATVYNAHYSAGSFTTAGTASLLTGLYPWTHRAINEGGLVTRSRVRQNLFAAMGHAHARLAYSQNLWANYFFGQFDADIESVLSPAAFSLNGELLSDHFPGDRLTSDRALDRFLFQDGEPPASLVFGLADRLLVQRAMSQENAHDYPAGFPQTENYPIFFRLRDVFDGVNASLKKLDGPWLAYVHLWAPHEPYSPSSAFAQLFNDDWNPDDKPQHALVDPALVRTKMQLYRERRRYDQYIAEVDFEFGRLMDSLQAAGTLDSTYVVVTSDHGEFIERGVNSHLTPLLYDPVVRVPLLIAAPGQDTKREVKTPTVSVDVLPTLVQLAAGEAGEWHEGQVLPGLGGVEDPQRSIFMMDAKKSAAFGPLPIASFAIRKGNYKLIYYRGYAQYAGEDRFELFDLANDAEELKELYSAEPAVAKGLREELLSAIEAAADS